LPDAEFGHVKEMPGRFVQQLEKSGVQSESATRLEHAMDLAHRARRIAQMFEDIEGKDTIEAHPEWLERTQS
jgi:hypothetical protein